MFNKKVEQEDTRWRQKYYLILKKYDELCHENNKLEQDIEIFKNVAHKFISSIYPALDPMEKWATVYQEYFKEKTKLLPQPPIRK
jgi:hypothetical protein